MPKIIFAALDSDIARELEPKFAAAGCAVVSNSSAFRMTPDVPLVVPEVNADHLELLEQQSWRKRFRRLHRHQSQLLRHWPRARAEAAGRTLRHRERVRLHHAGGERRWISGRRVARHPRQRRSVHQERGREAAGRGGQAARPRVSTLGVPKIEMLDAKVSAHCNRVAVEDGHTECVSIKLRTKASREEVLAAWSEFAPLRGNGLPSAPEQPVEFDASVDRPQPRLDRMRGNGMATTVGRLRECTSAGLEVRRALAQHHPRRRRRGDAERRGPGASWEAGRIEGDARRQRKAGGGAGVSRGSSSTAARPELVVMKFGGTSVEDASSHAPHRGHRARTSRARTAAGCCRLRHGEGDGPAAGRRRSGRTRRQGGCAGDRLAPAPSAPRDGQQICSAAICFTEVEDRFIGASIRSTICCAASRPSAN